MRHKNMLHRRLLYTAVTRAKEKLIIVGDVDACKLAAERDKDEERCTLLLDRLREA